MQRFVILLMSVIFIFSCQPTKIKTNKPGVHKDFIQLPNGWRLTPAGQQIPIGELPLNLLITPDEQWAITSNSGTAEHSLSLVSLKDFKERQRLLLPKTWRGLAANEDGSEIFVSGGNDDCVYILGWQADTLTVQDTIFLSAPKSQNPISVTGLTYWQGARSLLVVTKKSNQLYLVSLKNKQIEKSLQMPAECYDVILSPEEKSAWISIWGGAKVISVDLKTFQIKDQISVGEHPCEMQITENGRWLFVANANQNSVSVIDLQKRKVVETLNSGLLAHLPPGSTPNSLTLSADQKTLFIANADNNYVAVFDVTEPGHSKSLGFIPVGWYPTAIRMLKNAQQLLVTNGKGVASAPNPQGPKPGHPELTYDHEQYIGQMLKGMLSVIKMPDARQLAEWSSQVYQNTPFTRNQSRSRIKQSVIPNRHNGQRSPFIKHVFYIIRENRTYDQVFGDLKQGDGDSALCLFPRKITPNAHALAENFVLFDNFYVDAEVSADGHNWSTAAYATDYVEKTWPTLYGGRGGSYDFESANISHPFSGFIWDNALKHGRNVRDYGEYVQPDPNHKGRFVGLTARLKGNVCPIFPGWDLKIPDTLRFARWKADFDSLIAINRIADLNIVRFPNDHTAGTNPDFPTVNAMIAENDYALGLFVEHLSHSAIWKSSVVFVLEDDAQNGSDHVDAHRSPLLVIGPYVKRHFVDHTMYSTSSVLKTMELILGLPPMTQYDLAATPILNAFTNQPDFSPYSVIKPQQNLHEMNTIQSYKAQRCKELNFSREDAIPDIEFNEIIWKAVKGIHSEMPAPVRSAFVRLQEEDE